MCKPHRCPHINFTGNICVYCPGGPDSDFEYSTQSYTGYEPTSMRAIRARYNPYLQTRSRVEQSVVILKAQSEVKMISLAERNINYYFSPLGIKSENVFCHKFNDKKCDVHQMQNMGSFVKDPEFLRRGYILEMQSRKRKAEPFTLPGAAIVSDSEPLKKKPFPESYSQRRISKMSNVIRFGNGLTHSLDLSSYKISAEVKDKLVCLLGQKFGLLFDRDYQLNNPNKLAFFESYSPLLYESDINPFSVVDLISILTPNKWLTTRAVSFAINFVSRSFQNVYTISCDANLPLVSATPRPDKQEELLKAFYQVPKHCSVLLLPLYVKAGQYISDTGRNHFILAVINFKESCFHLMDGFSPSNRKEAAIILKRIQALCQNDERYLKLSCKSYPVHKQNDIYNCGMYAIIHTNEYLEKQISSEHVQPDFPIQEVLQRLRPELCLQILEDMCMVHDRHLFCYICGDKPEDKKQLRCDLCAAVVCKSHDFHLCMMCNPGSDEVLNETNLEGSEKAQDSKPPVTESFHLAKDCGFKVVAHMMPDLPNVGLERDVEQFIEFFENPAFRADGLKIYPTLVIRGTGLYELWKTGRYQSYPPNTLVDLVARILALVPPWTRVYRVQRDIPMPLVSSGVEHGNLRELALARMKDFGTECRDVRTREVGIQEIHQKVRPYEVELVRRDYVANNGWETFLSYEDPQQDILIGLLRLRKCSDDTFRPELKNGVSIVRELHVYGSVVPVSARDPRKFQHQGFGTLLMEEAERIALEEHGSHKIAVISGVGTRNYYRKLGYELEGPYMVKFLL
ncbi:hypothetical protein QYM36_001140 [Artemia franciscana]|uniref:Elongator complex protein 3 n=2 Tax=Artemia franciscana TaxID=6661 RepID=A0AA88I8J5_ARTSF|nr:hypothetical protein QYM36_001140 [Artemia franciscana]